MSDSVGLSQAKRFDRIEIELARELEFMVSALARWDGSRELSDRGELRLSLARAERCIAVLSNASLSAPAGAAGDVEPVVGLCRMQLSEAAALVERAQLLINRVPKVGKSEGNVVHLELVESEDDGGVANEILAALNLNQLLDDDYESMRATRRTGLRLAYSASRHDRS